MRDRRIGHHSTAPEKSVRLFSAAEGGDLGFFQKGDMVAEFEKVAFALNKDEISEPFESPFGYHIVKLMALKEAQVKPLEEVEKEIISAIQYDQAEKIFVQKLPLK